MLTSLIHAQNDYPKFLIGGSTDLSGYFTKSNFSGEDIRESRISFNPQFGYFLFEQFLIGLSGSVDYQKSGDTKQTSITFGPVVRLYTNPTSSVRCYVQGNYGVAGLNMTNVDESHQTVTQDLSGDAYALGLGLAFYLNKHISFDSMFGYHAIILESKLKNRGLGLNFGFNIFL